jgi:hypothetical protein
MEIYFDTNVYDFITRQQEEIAIRKFLDENSFNVKASSGNINEILATKNQSHRLAQLAAVVIIASSYEDFPQSWTHAEEVRSEITRCHPEWLRHAPSRRLLRNAEFFLDEHRKQWHEIRSLQLPAQEAFAVYQQDVQQGIKMNLEFQSKLKDHMRTEGTTFSLVSSRQGKETLVQQSKALTADEYWRFDCLLVWFNAIVKRMKASRDYADWLLPYLKDDAFRRSTYHRFWLEEVDQTRVAKNRGSPGLAVNVPRCRVAPRVEILHNRMVTRL